MISDDNAEKCAHFIIENAKKVAERKAQAEYLKEYRKTLKAELMIEAEMSHGITTSAHQEKYAYAHAKYKEHLTLIRDAVYLYEQANLTIIAKQMELDIWRTQSANARKM
jgi:hypothetical protein